jgi:acyl-CoA synthetase (AMP-forming)/AMP-acid ligase II
MSEGIWRGARPQNVHEAFARAVRDYADKPFLDVLPEVAKVYGIAPGALTYAQANVEVARLAGQFRAAGYGRGHRVGLLLENRPVYFLNWFALNSLGVSVVPINPDLRSTELQYLIAHSEMAAAIVLPSRQAEVAAAARAAQCATVVMTPDVAPARFAQTAAVSEAAGCDDECAVLYTSGTTGQPKGCVLTNDYFLFTAEWYAGLGGLCAMRPGNERMLTPLPTFHMNAMATSGMTMVALGGCLIPLDRFHPKSWWHCVRESQATVVHYLGVMPAILMSAPASTDDRRHQVRFGFGAGVPRDLHVPFEERFNVPLIEAWAMTETGSGAVMAASQEPRHRGTGCIGRPAPGLEVRLVRDDGSDVAVDEPGELLVRREGARPRRGFFDHYLKDEKATAAAWEGGWFHTGDLVRRDADGYMYFVDRSKNVIRRSGENISAVEVERVLSEYPQFKGRAVAVTAVPDALRGDEVFACVEAAGVFQSDAEREAAAIDLVRWCLERMAYFKAPGYVAFVEKLPVTSTQKIQRRGLKELAAELLSQQQCVDARSLKKRQVIDESPRAATGA